MVGDRDMDEQRAGNLGPSLMERQAQLLGKPPVSRAPARSPHIDGANACLFGAP